MAASIPIKATPLENSLATVAGLYGDGRPTCCPACGACECHGGDSPSLWLRCRACAWAVSGPDTLLNYIMTEQGVTRSKAAAILSGKSPRHASPKINSVVPDANDDLISNRYRFCQAPVSAVQSLSRDAYGGFQEMVIANPVGRASFPCRPMLRVRPMAAVCFRNRAGAVIGAEIEAEKIGRLELRYGEWLGTVWPQASGRYSPTNCRNGWIAHPMPEPLPLSCNGDMRLANNLPIVLVEDQASRRGAHQLSGMILTIWPGGLETIEQGRAVDWSPLRWRKVLVWPRNNARSNQVASAVAEMARQSGATTVAVMDTVDRGLSEATGPAELLAGMDWRQAREFLINHGFGQFCR